jgi:hypothetical protein
MLHASALHFCESVEASPGGFLLTMELLSKTSRPEVEFYCLQSIQRALQGPSRHHDLNSNNNNNVGTGHLQQSPQDRIRTRTSLMRWIESLTNKPPPPAYVWKKTGVVMALLIKHEFPNEWPTAFDELCHSLNHGGKYAADLFLATLQALDEEIVSVHGQEATRIKDAMRVLAVPKIVASFSALIASYQNIDPEIVRQTLTTCSLYVSWIDIGLVTSDPFLSLWFNACRDIRYRGAATGLLSRALRKGMSYGAKIHLVHNLGLADAAVDLANVVLGTSSSEPINNNVRLSYSPPPLVPSAWLSIMGSTTTSNHHHHPSTFISPISLTTNNHHHSHQGRLNTPILLHHLTNNGQQPPLSPVLSSVASTSSAPSSPMIFNSTTLNNNDDFITEVGKFCETLGVELLKCRESAMEAHDQAAVLATEQLLERAVASMLTCLSTSDMRIHRPALEFAILLDAKYCTENLLHAALWCAKHIVQSSMKRISTSSSLTVVPPPSAFTMNNNVTTTNIILPTIEEIDELSRTVKRFFTQLTKKIPPRQILTYLEKAVAYFLHPTCVDKPSADIEALLFLIYSFGDGATDLVHRTGLKDDVEQFDRLLDGIFSSDLPSHASPKVIALHHDLAAKYVIALRAQPIGKVCHVLESLVGRGGVHHPHPKVRSRSVGVVLRFVRSLGPLPAFAQLVDPILNVLQDVLRIDLQSILSSTPQGVFSTRPRSGSMNNFIMRGSSSGSGSGGGGGNNNNANSSGTTSSGNSNNPSGGGVGSSSIIMDDFNQYDDYTNHNHYSNEFLQPVFSLSDSMSLYEVVGLLLWSCDQREKQLSYFTAVVEPLMGNISHSVQLCNQIRERCVVNNNNSNMDSQSWIVSAWIEWEPCMMWAAASLEAFSCVAKCGSMLMIGGSSSSTTNTPGNSLTPPTMTILTPAAAANNTTPAATDTVPVRRWDITIGFLKMKFQSCIETIFILLTGLTQEMSLLPRTERIYSRMLQTFELIMSSFKRLCHSMIQCLGIEFLSFTKPVIEVLLLGNNDAMDIAKPFALLNQMMSTFRGQMITQLDQVLIPVLRAANSKIAPIANRVHPNQNDLVELIVLEKELFTFLSYIAMFDLSRTLLTQQHLPYLDELLRMLTDGLASIPDASVQQKCCITLQALIKEWAGTTTTTSLGDTHNNGDGNFKNIFSQFVFERVTQSSFQATAQPHFDLRDAACMNLLVAICGLHRLCVEKYGDTWLQYVCNGYLPSVNCPPSVAQEYCTAIINVKSAKSLKNEFRRLFLGGTATTTTTATTPTTTIMSSNNNNNIMGGEDINYMSRMSSGE